MAKRNTDREFIIEFLNLYRQYPTLWKVKSKEYSDRKLKNGAYRALIEKYKEIDAEADRETVKRKINSLRTNYRKELCKIKAYRSSTGSDDGYESSLWYFDELSFLQHQEESVEVHPTITLKSEDGDEEDQNLQEEQETDTVTVSTPNHRPKPATEARRLKRRKTVASQASLQDEFSFACAHLKKPDEYENIAITWANELKRMTVNQQIYAKKAINEILFEGQLGTLHRHSVTINANTALFGTNEFRILTPSSSASSTSTSLPSPQQ